MSQERLPIVVGVEETVASHAALRWAVTEAAARKAPLRIVCAYQPILPGGRSLYADTTLYDYRWAQHAAETTVQRAAEHAQATDGSVSVSTAVLEGNAATELIAESQSAQLVVVGSRHYETLHAGVLGSVSSAVAARAECPVVVVTGPAAPPTEGAAVIVGVDATDHTEPVLRFAFEYASRHHAPLHAVLCWHLDPIYEMAWRGQQPVPDRVEAWLSEALAGWREKFPDVRVTAGAIREHAVPGLVAAAHGQHLLVVGARGRHALTGTLLGSVSQGVLHHATCPVAVVRAS
jgi:nucleotide-binding universal stress UspA family protein